MPSLLDNLDPTTQQALAPYIEVARTDRSLLTPESYGITPEQAYRTPVSAEGSVPRTTYKTILEGLNQPWLGRLYNASMEGTPAGRMLDKERQLAAEDEELAYNRDLNVIRRMNATVGLMNALKGLNEQSALSQEYADLSQIYGADKAKQMLSTKYSPKDTGNKLPAAKVQEVMAVAGRRALANGRAEPSVEDYEYAENLVYNRTGSGSISDKVQQVNDLVGRGYSQNDAVDIVYNRTPAKGEITPEKVRQINDLVGRGYTQADAVDIVYNRSAKGETQPDKVQQINDLVNRGYTPNEAVDIVYNRSKDKGQLPTAKVQEMDDLEARGYSREDAAAMVYGTKGTSPEDKRAERREGQMDSVLAKSIASEMDKLSAMVPLNATATRVLKKLDSGYSLPFMGVPGVNAIPGIGQALLSDEDQVFLQDLNTLGNNWRAMTRTDVVGGNQVSNYEQMIVGLGVPGTDKTPEQNKRIISAGLEIIQLRQKVASEMLDMFNKGVPAPEVYKKALETQNRLIRELDEKHGLAGPKPVSKDVRSKVMPDGSVKQFVSDGKGGWVEYGR